MQHLPQPAANHPPDEMPRRGETGTSLVELTVMVTAAVMLLACIFSGVVSHNSQRRMHSEKLLAMAACRSTLEQLRAVPFTTLATYNGTGFDVPGIDGQPRGLTPLAGDADNLPGEIYVTVNRSSGGTILYTVRARVRWRGATRNGDFSIETLMGERR